MYKKIDIFENGKYMCSTNQYKTCKEALKACIDNHWSTDYSDTVKIYTAHFSKENK